MSNSSKPPFVESDFSADGLFVLKVFENAPVELQEAMLALAESGAKDYDLMIEPPPPHTVHEIEFFNLVITSPNKPNLNECRECMAGRSKPAHLTKN